jgi:arabinose-5-phosphate isomerase
VLKREADALRSLSASIDGSFSAALDILYGVRGRVVVSGMGKSGHVGRKFAATLASTGTPALFVHPSEASHGDLGMVAREDAVVVLTNSGETPELNDLVAYARRTGIPLITISGQPKASQTLAANVALVLPNVDEADPMGLAPTTSTTMMMALGDALAMALLERRGFSADDFHALHPGGQLGRKLVKVADIMHTGENLPLIGADARMSDVLIEMSSKSFGCVGVADARGALLGIVTDGDLRRHMSDDLLTRLAGEIMTATPKTIPPGALAADALRQMNSSAITNLFVVDEKGIAGLLHIHDLLRAGVL